MPGRFRLPTAEPDCLGAIRSGLAEWRIQKEVERKTKKGRIIFFQINQSQLLLVN